MLSGVVRLITNHQSSASSQARQKSGSFPPLALDRTASPRVPETPQSCPGAATTVRSQSTAASFALCPIQRPALGCLPSCLSARGATCPDHLHPPTHSEADNGLGYPRVPASVAPRFLAQRRHTTAPRCHRARRPSPRPSDDANCLEIGALNSYDVVAPPGLSQLIRDLDFIAMHDE